MFQNTFLFCNIGLYAAIIILINDYMRKSAMFWNPASGQKMNLHLKFRNEPKWKYSKIVMISLSDKEALRRGRERDR